MSTSTTPAPELDPADFLRAVRRRIRSAEFEDSLLDDAELLMSMQAGLRTTNQILYFKSLNSAFEIFDYFGLYAKARNAVIQEGMLAHAECEQWVRDDAPATQSLIRERTAILLHYGLSEYRWGSYWIAERVFDRVRAVVGRCLQSKDDPCDSILSALEYFCGQTYRQLSSYDQAAAAFNASIEHAVRRLKWCRRKTGDQTSDDPWIIQEARRSNRRCALALALGLGWITARQGYLSRALPLFWISRRLLFSTGDWVSKAYVELLFGSVQRAMAGSQEAKIAEARETLEFAYEQFGQSKGGASEGHRPYRLHAAYQMALASVNAGEYAAASSFVTEMRTLALGLSSTRWECISYIVESRILRKDNNAGTALDAAITAVDLAKRLPDRACEVDALIARGECRSEGGNQTGAKSDFMLALSLAEHNPQTEGVCHIHLARVSLKEGNVYDAENHLLAWRAVAKDIENPIIIELAQAAQRELESQRRNFFIPGDATDLRFGWHEERLWEFLLEIASRGDATDAVIADRLAIGRSVLNKRRGPKKKRESSPNGAPDAKPNGKATGAAAGEARG